MFYTPTIGDYIFCWLFRILSVAMFGTALASALLFVAGLGIIIALAFSA